MARYDDVLARIRGALPDMYPHIASDPDMAEPLIEQLAYETWMEERAYDHVTISPKQSIFSGTVYKNEFFRAPSGQRGRVDTITLSREEMLEFIALACKRLGIDVVNGEVRGQAEKEGSRG